MRGADPTKQRAAAVPRITAAATSSITKAWWANGRLPRVLEPEEAVLDRDEEAGQGGQGEPRPDQGHPEAAHGNHGQTDHQTGDGLEQEERTDGGDGVVALVVPEVEVDVGGPEQEGTADHEGAGGGQVRGAAGAAGSPQQEGESCVHAIHPDPGGRLDVGCGLGARQGYGPAAARDSPDLGKSRRSTLSVDLWMRESRVDSGELSDEDLLAGMAVGEQAAAVAFVRRYQRRVFGLAYSMTSDPGVAEDVAQEAMTRVWRHAPVFDPRRGSVTSWVLTITRNLAIDALRTAPGRPDRSRRLRHRHAGQQRARPRGHGGAAATPAGSSGLRSRVLPDEQRRAVVLAAVYGRTALEISESEGIPLGTAKTRIRTALIRLRAAIDQAEGVNDER